MDSNDQEYLRESTQIQPDDLRSEYIRVPSDMAYWGERYAEAVLEHLRAEQSLKAERARLHLYIREIAVAKGQKMTVDDVDAWIEASQEYRVVKLAAVEAEAAKVAARCRLDAVTAKKDMCVSLGAHQRAEMAPMNMSYRDR